MTDRPEQDYDYADRSTDPTQLDGVEEGGRPLLQGSAHVHLLSLLDYLFFLPWFSFFPHWFLVFLLID